MLKRLVAAAVAALFLTGAAQAASAYTTKAVNMRSAPAKRGEIIVTIPAGKVIQVNGCLENYRWCDVRWRGRRGWVSTHALAFQEARRRSFPDYAIHLGVPLWYGQGYYEPWYWTGPSHGGGWHPHGHGGHGGNWPHNPGGNPHPHNPGGNPHPHNPGGNPHNPGGGNPPPFIPRPRAEAPLPGNDNTVHPDALPRNRLWQNGGTLRGWGGD